MYSSFGGGAVPLPSSPNLFVMEGSVFGAMAMTQPRTAIRSVCAFCEGSWQVPVGVVKSREQKALEDIAADHFKRRILKAEETSLDEGQSILEDVERCCTLLNSVVLCDGCISRFCRSEERVLKAQMEYLETKMTGSKEFEDVLADPWLDLKRFAYAKLKSQQPSISEKLRLIQQLLPSENERGSIISASVSGNSSTMEMEQSIGTGATATGTGTLLPMTVSIPQLPGHGDSISVDVQFPPLCQFTVPSEASNSSSTPHSPDDRHNNNEKKTESLTSAQSPSGYETANDEQESVMNVNNSMTTAGSTKEDSSSKSVTIGETETPKDSTQATVLNLVISTPKPSPWSKKIANGESAREDEDSDSDDSSNTVEISSIKSATPGPRSRKPPARAKKAEKNLSETDTPTAKRAKLDLGASASATATPNVPAGGVVYAKKSTPVPSGPGSPVQKVKGKPGAASTPKDDPKNKASRKSVAATDANKPGKVAEKEKTVPKNDKSSGSTSGSGFSTPKQKSPKKTLKVGGRVFTETSCSSSSGSDSDSD